jgi:hypothetical protein
MGVKEPVDVSVEKTLTPPTIGGEEITPSDAIRN